MEEQSDQLTGFFHVSLFEITEMPLLMFYLEYKNMDISPLDQMSLTAGEGLDTIE